MSERRSWRDDPRFGDVLRTSGDVIVKVVGVTPYGIATETRNMRGKVRISKHSWQWWRDHYPRYAVKLVESEYKDQQND